MRKSKSERLITKKTGMAINRYGMIEAEDKVLVGVSGGKDSLTLLNVLQERKKHLPVDYTVMAIHVITDYDQQPEVSRGMLEECFKAVGCEYIFKEIAIEKNNKLGRQDCFWCSWNRRRAVFEAADEMGFRKIAFGHHKDDAVETILMNMVFKGELSGINPVQDLFGGKISIIRPLIFLEEKEIAEYAKEKALDVIKSDCPRNSGSKRAVIKKIICRLAEENQDIKTNIINAPHRIRKDYLAEMTE